MKNFLWLMRILVGLTLIIGASMMIIADIVFIIDILRGAEEELWVYVFLFVVFVGVWIFGLQLMRGKIVWKKTPEEEVYVPEPPVQEYTAQEGPIAATGTMQSRTMQENSVHNAGATGNVRTDATEATRPKPQTSGAIPIIRAWKYECRDAVYREYRMRRIIAPVAIPVIYMALLLLTVWVMIATANNNTLFMFVVFIIFTLLPFMMIPFTRPKEPLGMHMYLLTGDYRLWLVDLKQDDVQYFLFQEYGLEPQYYKHINSRRWIRILVREWKYMKQLKYIEENGLLDQWLTTGQAVNLADPLSVQKLRESVNQLNVTFRALNEYTGKVRKVYAVFRRKNYSDFDGLLSALRNAENKEGF